MSVDCSDGASYDVWDETHPVARKEHQCCACGETVRVGHRYRRRFTVFDGEADTDKYCLRCAEMYDQISKRLDSDQVPDVHLNCGHSWEELHGECPPEIQRLAFLTPAEMQRELQGRFTGKWDQ